MITRSRRSFAGPTALVVLACVLAAPSRAAAPDVSPQVSEGVVHTSPAELWKVFTTPEGHRKLGVARCELDLRVGGIIRTAYDATTDLHGEGAIQNEILAYEPERMFAFRIHQPPKGFPFPSAWRNTWTVATLTDLGDGSTFLRVTGMGYDTTAESQRMRAFFRTGNDWTLKTLQAAFDSTAPAPAGPAHAAKPLDPIAKTELLPVSRDEAWVLFATREGWKRVIAQDAEIEPWPGGKFEIHFDLSAPKGEQGSEGCTVLSLVPGEMLSWSWNAPPKLPFARSQRTWVVLRLEELGPRLTRVRLEHLGFAELAARFPEHRGEFEQTRAYFDRAWGMVLQAANAAAAKS